MVGRYTQIYVLAKYPNTHKNKIIIFKISNNNALSKRIAAALKKKYKAVKDFILTSFQKPHDLFLNRYINE